MSRARLVLSSPALGAAVLVATGAASLFVGEATAMVAMGALTAYSVLDPVVNVTRRSWWSGAAISCAVWLALFLALPAFSEAVAPVREGLMVFLVPMMVYPTALVLSGVARLLVRTIHSRTVST